VPLTLQQVIDAAKKLLDEVGYIDYVVEAAELSGDGRTWAVKINSISGRTTIIIDGTTGEAVRLWDDD
jgi:hypothetical protein